MKQIWLIGAQDIRLFLKGKLGYIWLFLVPILFVYFTGAAALGPGAPRSPKPSVLIENLDDGFLSELLMEELGAQGMNLVPPENAAEAERGIRIPEGFTESVRNKERVEIEFFTTSDSSSESAAMIELRLTRALIALNSHLFENATKALFIEKPSEPSIRKLMERESRVPLEVSFAGRRPIPVGFNQSLPANMVMFLMLNLLIFGGASIAGERQSGVLRRLAVHPVSQLQIVSGKILGRFLLGCVQIVFFMTAGRVLFGVNVGGNLIAITTTLLIYAWLAASLGVLIGAITSNPDKTTGLCVLATMIMSALGGCWWPMEIVPDTFKMIGHIFPTAWAMDALHQLITFGNGWSNIMMPLAALTAYATAATIGAAKLLKI